MKSILIFLIATLSCIKLQAQWNPANSGTTEALYDIFFINDQVGYVVGGGDAFGYPKQNSNGVILKTTDSGQTWNLAFNQPVLAIYSVVVVNSIVQCYGRNQNGPVSISSTDNGQNWTSTQLTYFPQEVKSSGNIIYFMKGSTTTLKKIENGAMSIVANDVGKFGVNGNELVYVNGYYNTIYKSTDYGNTFSPLNGYPTGTPGFGQDQSANAVIKSFGDTLIVHYTYPPKCQYSTDNGSTWVITSSGPGNCSIISKNLSVSGYHNSIYYLLNFENFTLQATLSDEIRKIYIYDKNLGFAVGDNGMIYKTTNVVGLGFANPEIEKKIRIYPNPAENTLNLEIAEQISIEKICLTDMRGRLVKEYTGNFSKLDVSDITTGNYLLHVYTNQGKTTKKILVE